MVPLRVAMAHGLVASARGPPPKRSSSTSTRKSTSASSASSPRTTTTTSVARSGKRAEGCGIGVLPEDRSYDNPDPAIDGLWDYCLRYAGGSLAAARRALGSSASDIAINWSGGMHHTCDEKASG